MKVLRIINSLKIGGAERSLETNVPLHLKNGIEMDILVLDSSNTMFYNSLNKNNVNIFKTSNCNFSIYNPIHIFKIIPYLKKYDIIHVHLFPCLYWVAIAKLLSFNKVKLVYTEHSTENFRRKKIFKFIEHFIYKQYDVIIAITEATKSKLYKHVKHPNIQVIYNGIDLDFFRKFDKCFKKTDVVRTNETFVITQIASFRIQKDQETVIKAISILPEIFELLLIGDGERIEFIKNIVNKLNLTSRVHFLGNRQDIPNLINISDVIVVSSIYEGFGRVAIESMANSKPVIGTNVPGLREVVQNAGILFNVKDYEELSNILLKLYNDTKYYNEISNKCFERSKNYNINKMIYEYESVYKSLMLL